MLFIKDDFKPSENMIDDIKNMLFNVVYEPNETTRLSLLRQKQEEAERLAAIKKRDEEISRRNDADLERRISFFNRHFNNSDV